MKPYKIIFEQDVYTWPNPHFPFKCLLNHKKCRIFILENIPHNYIWLDKYKNNIRDTDFFFVTLGWFLSGHLANQSRAILDQFKLNIDNFYILYNSPEEESNGLKFGLKGSVINHNAWIDEQALKPILLTKKYKALYIARPTDFKRHYLAQKVKGLALAAGGFNHRNLQVDLPPSINEAGKHLTKKEICEIINESNCGLCLSREEGACYSSSEYLLCGVPVVSTRSRGGRDVWYTEENSIICTDSEEGVKEAVEELKKAHAAQDVAQIDAATEKLNAALQTIQADVQAAYAQQQQAGGDAAGAQPGADQAQGNADEEVTDVDFEEVK